MRFKRLLALLLAAALALAVLVGCGSGQQSAARVLLNLLDGKYPNISIEIDPDLEADLRQAVNEGETDAEIRAALEKLLGSGVSFRLIGDGQQGDSAWNLILYPGSDPDAAARSAYLEWNKIFSAFPSSGLYTAKLSMIETDNGYAILVKATVDKAARRNDDDDEPEEPKGPGYTDDGEGNYTVTTADGLKNVAKLVNEEGKTDIDITLTGNIDLTGDWTPIGTESQPYTGTFDGDGHTIKGLKIDKSGTDYVGLIGCLGSGGKVQNVTLTNISVSGANCVGGIAGQNYGTVENCSVNGTVTGKGFTDTGGIAGSNYGTISGCSAEGTVTGSVNVGGIAGLCVPNYDTGTSSLIGSTIKGCHSTAAVSGNSSVGGVLGNLGNGCSLMACYSTGNVTATITDGFAHVGGVVGINSQGTVTACYHATGTVSGQGNVGGVVGWNNNSGQTTACYWSSNPANGIGKMDSGTDDTTQVTDGDWSNAYNAMNTALAEAGSKWLYNEITGTLIKP